MNILNKSNEKQPSNKIRVEFKLGSKRLLSKDLIKFSILFLKMPQGISSNDWNDYFHAPTARNTPSTLRRNFGINIEKMAVVKTTSGKRYTPQRLADTTAAIKLAKLIKISSETHNLILDENINEIIKAYDQISCG
ncbi:hypothetical protein [Shewanella frigidimarina]|uniref:hypothetical protein n=1 Tax=Shewanella frigidimarina TaxID=56812 RepID=UPI003D7AB9B6